MNNNFKTLTKQNEIIELPSETDIRLNDMSVQIRKILLTLQQPMFTKDELKVFTDLYDYVKAYQRLLYSDVSSVIFEINKIHNDSKQSENMMYNIHRLLVFADELDVVTFQNYLKNKSKKKLTYNADCFKQTKNAINKLYDHVNLANNQYSIFQVTEEQFKKRVKQELENYKTEILKEIYGQLITIVSIFTALAFIVFGSIGSLSAVFQNIHETPMLKLILVSCMWSIGLINLIFVFLFCIGKMTRLTYKTDPSSKATFWQRYPVVCWTNFLLVSAIILIGFLYYFYQDTSLLEAIQIDHNGSAITILIVGILIISVVFYFSFRSLSKKTKPVNGYEDEDS